MAIRISLTEQNFRDLVAGKEIQVEAFIPHTWQDPSMKNTGEKETARIILQDIGWDVMSTAIRDASDEFYWKDTKEYKLGFDAGLNGPNEKNSHFTLFALPETARKWNAGFEAGKIKKSGNG